LADANTILVKIRAAIATIRYLSHTGTPDVNARLTGVINNVGAQWRHAQEIWNAGHPNDPTTVGDFWTEWVKDFFDVWLIKHVRKWAQGAIDILREAWNSSADPGAQGVLDALNSLNKELKTLKIDTSKFHK
jgi:chitinase